MSLEQSVTWLALEEVEPASVLTGLGPAGWISISPPYAVGANSPYFLLPAAYCPGKTSQRSGPFGCDAAAGGGPSGGSNSASR
jgi:hypothetical protein